LVQRRFLPFRSRVILLCPQRDRVRPQPVSRDAVVKLDDHPYEARYARGGAWLI
jgi:hypothetical protein